MYGSPNGSYIDPYIYGSLCGSYMHPYVDPMWIHIWTPYMWMDLNIGDLWKSIYGMDQYMGHIQIPIWILYGSIYGSPCICILILIRCGSIWMDPSIGDIWKWFQLMRLLFEVVRGPRAVVLGRLVVL